MYFPYMYGRQSELLAVRAMLTAERNLEPLIPVIEPVNLDIRNLSKCLSLCEEAGRPVAVITNPHQHQLAHASPQWQARANVLLAACPSAIPALKCGPHTTAANVSAFFRSMAGRDVAVIHAGSALSQTDFTALVGQRSVRFHIAMTNMVPAAQLSAIPRNKRVVVTDPFIRQARNADYDGTEFFSDAYKNFARTSIGFGDFTCIGAGFQPGGGAPAAVVIHAIFKSRESGDIWIEHFLSNDVERDQGDTASKFLQAATKLVRAVQRRPQEFGRNPALTAYAAHVQNGHFPQLGKNKELQMVHHMCLMLDVLSGVL